MENISNNEMETKQINTKICIPPSDLNSKIKENIVDKIKDKIIGKCYKDVGYICNLISLDGIMDSSILPTNPNIIFTVLITVEYLKPIIGKVYKTKVCMIFGRGIFAEIENNIKVLIPIDKIENYKYNDIDEIFEGKEKNIVKDDILDIKIYDFKYSNNMFNCLGVLV